MTPEVRSGISAGGTRMASRTVWMFSATVIQGYKAKL
jgi:hypothetical protein